MAEPQTSMAERQTSAGPAPSTVTILGVRFFQGTVSEAIARNCSGGLVVVPAAPALLNLPTDAGYREALLHANLVLPDSAFMVLVWRLLQGERLQRISGLTYLRALLAEADLREVGNTLWIMADREAGARNLAWLAGQGINVPASHSYIAPVYTAPIADAALLTLLERLRPRHVVVTIGGGKQEQLGLYLKRHLSYRPAIHCIGAAIAFLSGVQVRIPVWADRLYLGWLFRSAADPARFLPRYWAARRLFQLIRRYRESMPVA